MGFAWKQSGVSEQFSLFFTAIETFEETVQLHTLFILLAVSAEEKIRDPGSGYFQRD